jgi:hypothetical protein
VPASAAERLWQAPGRFLQVVVAFLLMVVTALAWALVAHTPAYAADAQIDSFTINYEMQPSGVLKVMETIVWRIGSNSGRHGMQRHLVIREPDPNSDDYSSRRGPSSLIICAAPIATTWLRTELRAARSRASTATPGPG